MPRDRLYELVAAALGEDVGSGDITTEATVPESARARATIVQKQPGVVYGLDVAEVVFRTLDPGVEQRRLVAEGEWRDGGPVLEVTGTARALLTGERTALNFLQRLSGIATLTAECVRAVAGTGVTILDTRKTTPGLRDLEKAAVAAGGGTNHRAGLHDAVLIKENHIALAGGVRKAVKAARSRLRDMPIEVECATVDEVDEALDAGADRLLLDNMTPDRLREAAARVGGRAELEASGGIDLKSLPDYASTGVQFISIGALTHSAPALDLGMDMERTR
jgi:nicotinate-nucleotide pyrophosphorylase (carboxylating)